MSRGKQINFIGKSNLNLNSATDMITDLAHRLEINIKLVDYEYDSETHFDFKYLNTHELVIEKHDEIDGGEIYQYCFLNSFFWTHHFSFGLL